MSANVRYFDWMEVVWTTKVSPESKLICSYLTRFMNKDKDMAWPSQARIMEETGLKKATLNRRLIELEDSGLIVRDSGNSKKTTRYIITIPNSLTERLLTDSTVSQGDHEQSHTETRVVSQGDSNISNTITPLIPQRVLPVDNLNIEAWEEYTKYRSENNMRTLKPASIRKNQRFLAKASFEDQQRVVDQSIRNGWTGLFELKEAKGNGANREDCGQDSRSRAKKVSDSLDEIAQEAHEQEMGGCDI